MAASFVALSQYFQARCGIPEKLVEVGHTVTRYVHIVAVESLATISHILPAAFSWGIKRIRGDVSLYTVPITINKVATTAQLFLHGSLNIKPQQSYNPLLLIHGDYGHPFTMLHFAEIAKQSSDCPVFSLFIPSIHQNEGFNDQAIIVDQVIDKIETLILEKKGIFKGVLGVGHSKGAMLLAERQFANENISKIAKTFLVAGPLRTSFHEEEFFEGPLKGIFKDVYPRIQKYEERRMYQIIPQNDWNATYKSMSARPGIDCHVVPGMHLSGLYCSKTSNLFKEFLNEKL